MESVGGNFGEDVSEMSTPVGGVHGGSATGSREGADEFSLPEWTIQVIVLSEERR
jgi:hypothetical protein